MKNQKTIDTVYVSTGQLFMDFMNYLQSDEYKEYIEKRPFEIISEGCFFTTKDNSIPYENRNAYEKDRYWVRVNESRIITHVLDRAFKRVNSKGSLDEKFDFPVKDEEAALNSALKIAEFYDLVIQTIFRNNPHLLALTHKIIETFVLIEYREEISDDKDLGEVRMPELDDALNRAFVDKQENAKLYEEMRRNTNRCTNFKLYNKILQLNIYFKLNIVNHMPKATRFTNGQMMDQSLNGALISARECQEAFDEMDKITYLRSVLEYIKQFKDLTVLSLHCRYYSTHKFHVLSGYIMEIEKMSNKLIKIFNKAYVDKQNHQIQHQQQYFQSAQQQQQYYQTTQQSQTVYQQQPLQQSQPSQQNREYTVKPNNYKSWFYDPSHQSGR